MRLRALALVVSLSLAGIVGCSGSNQAPKQASPKPVAKADFAPVPNPYSAIYKGIAEEEYRFFETAGALVAPNKSHRFLSRFDGNGWQLAALDSASTADKANWQLNLSFTGLGRGEAAPQDRAAVEPYLGECPDPLAKGATGACLRRVEFSHTDVTEYFINDQDGVEQGFEIAKRPDGEGRLALVQHIEGLQARVTDAGQTVVFYDDRGDRVNYSKLVVRDARGTSLKAELEVKSDTLRILVDDASAMYPIVVDPLATTAGWTQEGSKTGVLSGYSTASAGDVNGDGFGDVIISVPYFSNGQLYEGKVFVYLGSSNCLAATAAWTQEGNQADAYFGLSVASAGDVNGDGYGDVIIGAPYFDAKVMNEGKAFVFLGSANGLAATPAWTHYGSQAGNYFGLSLASAGDVNGDGYGDVIIGAPYFSDGETEEGGAFVFYGSSSGLSATANWSVSGGQAHAMFGSSVASAGDVNGDGYGDVIIGAPSFDDGKADEGEVFVYLGSASGLTTTSAWTQRGNCEYAKFGKSVASAGDVNGDGYGDIIIGAPGFSEGENSEGKVFVYYGSPSGLETAAAWTHTSNQASAYFGEAVASGGDVNGDGYGDVVIGSPGYDSGEEDEGKIFVYYGSPSGLPVLSNWSMECNMAMTNLGFSVASAGDVNGDGYGDIIIGANYMSVGEAYEDKAFVYLGSASGLSTKTVSWTLESNQSAANLGYAVASAGDVNGDGFGDVIIGSPNFRFGDARVGRVFVFLGSANGLGTMADWMQTGEQPDEQFGLSVASAGDVNGDGYGDVVIAAPYFNTFKGKVLVYLGSATGLAPTAAWMQEGEQAGEALGYTVASAGDVNGDGYGDVIIGAPYFDDGQTSEGKALVYLGSAAGLERTASWTQTGQQEAANLGYSVASAGDVNGDGYDDIIIGAPGFTAIYRNEGKAFVYLGSLTGLATTAVWTHTSNQLDAEFGSTVASAGDVNGDGYGDIIVSALSFDDGEKDEGKVFVYYGSNMGFPETSNWNAGGNQQNSRFGVSTASAGDVNGDGYGDLIIGASDFTSESVYYKGRVVVYLGSLNGLAKTIAWTQEGDQQNEGFGRSVASAGDVNGDGYGDIIIGAPGFDSEAGKVFSYYGNAGGAPSLAPRQSRIDNETPIQPGGHAYSDKTVKLSMLKRTTIGRTKVKLQWEIKPVGTPFDGSGLGSGSTWVDSGVPGTKEQIAEQVADLPQTDTHVYHWRARLLYQNGGWSRWAWYVPAGKGNQNHFRVSDCGDGLISGNEECEKEDDVWPGCCNPSSCSFEPIGFSCNADSNGCTANDSCDVAGACVAGVAPDCSAQNDQCNTGVCDSTGIATYACIKNPTPYENASCNADDNGCTVDDKCQSGVCVTGVAPDCSAQNDQCNTGACESTASNSYTCQKDPTLFENVSCDADSNGCTVGDKCQTGACVAGTAADCTAIDDQCNTGMCDSTGIATFTCLKNSASHENASCNADNNGCTVDDKCQSGACVAGSAKNCEDNVSCTNDTCDTATGECAHTTNALACEDNNSCTHEACDALSGCSHTALEDWTACDEAGHACFAGVCEKLAPNDTCETAITLEAGKSQEVALATYHAFLTVPESCLGKSITGKDAFYSFAVESGKNYTLKVTPTSGTDVAVVLWSDCQAASACLAGRDSAAAGGEEMANVSSAAYSGTVLIQVLASTLGENAGYSILINDAMPSDGDAEATDADGDNELTEQDDDVSVDGDGEIPEKDDDINVDGDSDTSETLVDGDSDSSDTEVDIPIPNSGSSGGCQSSTSQVGVLLLLGLLGGVLLRRRRS